MSDEARPILEVRGVTKTFPGVIANEDVDLTLHEGQVLCVLGENGAGKSTLMNTVFGLYQPDAGEIRLRGEPVQFHSSAGRHRRRHRDGAPALPADPRVHRRRERDAGRRDALPRVPRHGRRPLPHPRARRAVRLHDRPRRAGGRPVGGRAAAGRADQGALPAGRHPDPRRAHRRPHPRRGRRVLRRGPLPGGPGQVDHLHHPQAPRGARRRRPDRGPPRRQGGRQRRSEERHPAIAGHADGRSRRVVHHRQGRRPRRGEPVLDVSQLCGRRRPRRHHRRQPRPRGAGRRGVRHRRGRGQRPARAGRGHHGDASQAIRWRRHRRSQRHRRQPPRDHRARRRARARGPRQARGRGLLHDRRQPGAQPVPTAHRSLAEGCATTRPSSAMPRRW